ncbi:hypothetical protein [Labrys sp. ZIDIC5]|uniref:hypothetical protein n=1 Tax=Labrys sedimenti TaxID=3106036 RepID=UPI002ACAEAE0|nr:hypothetical protein [Labrys sp. ZIDIC5]MDZ5453893.1 hypothetical protein [Labrys sp. ZIDIC5]
MSIERVELQRAGEGYPLDDVIIQGVTRIGEPATLEVQVKRTIKFTRGDAVFKDVVAQLARAYAKLDLSHQRHQFAVATERNSFKITGAYQDVLRWAREISSPTTFIARIDRKGVCNDDMRSFVATVRAHLAEFGCANDDQTIWQILRRFQILPFDYDAPGSQSLELATERSRSVLEPDEVSRASGFWKALTETAIRTAASGGDLDRRRLLETLTNVDSFRVRGSLRNRLARETLSDAASLTAADLRCDIAGVTLARSAQLQAVRESRAMGRYIEIQGGPGVGKSGVLGMLVQQTLREANAIVLSPERTTPGGWLAFKTALGVDASPKAFLSDLASDGGAVLFVDSLDFFDDDSKRKTVVDLVRTAADIPNFQIIVTVRTGFDKDEPNWLPSDVLDRLGRASPVVIQDIGEQELDELKEAKPALRALLADDHPARPIARNLFRLSRLLDVQGPTEDLRSEVDLLERWWTTADGAPAGRRERARLLRDLSEGVLGGVDHLTTQAPPAAVESLVSSGTLRELALDRVTFRHDVLREWAIAWLLHSAPSTVNRLPLSQTAAASLVRGVELGARLALERSSDARSWVSYLDRVSVPGAHPSWRRWSLLAILRSEHGFALLDQAATSLFEQDGALLRELIRTAIAVEARPLADLLTEKGGGLPAIPAGLYGPANMSWATLACWLIKRQADLPIQALPDIVELFQHLAMSTLLRGEFTQLMARSLADWLDEIEEAREHRLFAQPEPRFKAGFRYHELEKLAVDVQRAFALMAISVPERAQRYLLGVVERNNTYTIRNLMTFRGTLAQAAPVELAELTILGLIQRPEDYPTNRRSHDTIFSHLDSDFLPSSPAQGPFWDLLNSAPQQGLPLIRRLVEHAVTCISTGQEPGKDGLTLELPSGPRFFPWEHTYDWSRGTGSLFAVESGLMALEAWSHMRMERGDPVAEIIDDILGPDGTPVAFLLVAVDILISHWPQTIPAALPFLGSPELMSLDHVRLARDWLPGLNPVGFGAVGPKEPGATISLADIRQRPSRRAALENLLGEFAHSKDADVTRLRVLLQASAERLGEPQLGDTLVEPRLMARRALNAIDPANWHTENGERVYVPPPDELAHNADLQARYSAESSDFSMDFALLGVLEHADRSSPELVERAVIHARRLQSLDNDAAEDVLRSRTIAIVSAAMITARDASDMFLGEHEDWVRQAIEKAIATTAPDIASGMREGIRYNPISIATLGLIHLWLRKQSDADRDTLLDLAGRDTSEAAQGFGAGLGIIRQRDRRLLRAALRCAMTAQIKPFHQWNTPEKAQSADQAQHRRRVEAAIAAERAWLHGHVGEPVWPALPAPAPRTRSGIRIGAAPIEARTHRQAEPEELFHSQAGALWVRQLTGAFDPEDHDWLREFVNAYADWTGKANGSEFERHADVENRFDGWNDVFYRLVARALLKLSPGDAAAEVSRFIDVPDRSFFDIVPVLATSIDDLYFNGHGLNRETAVQIRDHLVDRLMQSHDWHREQKRLELTVESRIGPAIAALFFNHYSPISGSNCYLFAKAVDQVDAFLPKLSQLIETGPVPFTAILTMNLLEVSHAPRHDGFFLSSALVWLRRQPDNTGLWVEVGLGKRLALWIEVLMSSDPSVRSASHPLRPRIDDALARLVRAGVPEAHRIERALANDIP